MAEKEKEKVKKRKPTALKRDLQNEKKRLQNRTFKARLRTAMRSFEKALSNKEVDSAKQHLSSVYKMMDKGVKLNIFKKNKAARTKAQYSLHLSKVSG